MRRRLAPILGIAVALLVLGVAEGALRASGYGAREPFFLERTDALGHAWVVTNREVGENWFRTPEWEPQIKSPRIERFTAEKPAGTYRVFVIGESSAYGTPWGQNAAWPAMLETVLAATSGKAVEVLNCGVRASSLDIQPAIVEEIRRYAPDLLVVYAGHNEYYGVREPGAIEDLRLYRKLQGWLVHGPGADSDVRIGLRATYTVSPDDPVHGQVVARMKRDLGRVLDAAGDVPVIVTVPWSNERDLAPVGSYAPEAAKADAEKASKLVSTVELTPEGVGAAKADLDALAQALPQHAGVQHALGLAAYQAGDGAEARRRFRASIDLDMVPLRARTETIAAIRETVTGRTAGVSGLCDPEQAFRGASSQGVLGHDLFTDHVHPSLEGGWLLAKEIARCVGADARFGLPADPAKAPSLEEVMARNGVDVVDEYVGCVTMEDYFRTATVQASPSRDRSLAWYGALRATLWDTLDPLQRRALQGMVGGDNAHMRIARTVDPRFDPDRWVRELRAAVAWQPGAGMAHAALARALRMTGDEAGAREEGAAALFYGLPDDQAARLAAELGLQVAGSSMTSR